MSKQGSPWNSDKGTFIYSNGDIADVTVVGNTADKDFVIYDVDTDTFTAADHQTDIAYFFCTRKGISILLRILNDII